MKKFNFIDLDKSKLPVTKGKRIDGFRFYNIDGKAYPSVTSVLGIKKKAELQGWREKIGEDVANWEMGRAARRGKATHTLIEQYLKGLTPSERGVLPLGLFRLIKPYVDQIDNIHCLETFLYSHYLGLAGRVDCIAEFDGELAVIDFKTSTKSKQEDHIEHYFVQETAYAAMFLERAGIEVKKIVTLIATEEGSTQVFQKYNLDDYLQLLKSYIEDFVRGKTNA